MDITSHPELQLNLNQTTYHRGDTVTFQLERLSEDMTYIVNIFAYNLVEKGLGEQVSFSTGQFLEVICDLCD